MAESLPPIKAAKLVKTKGGWVQDDPNQIEYEVSYTLPEERGSTNGATFSVGVANDPDKNTSRYLSVEASQVTWTSGAKGPLKKKFTLADKGADLLYERNESEYESVVDRYGKSSVDGHPLPDNTPAGIKYTKYSTQEVKVLTLLTARDVNGKQMYSVSNDDAMTEDYEFFIKTDSASTETDAVEGTPGAPVTTSVTTTFVQKGSGIETNLRLVKNSFGAPRQRSVVSNGRDGQVLRESVGATWRNGFIHTFEGNPAYETFSHMYGFRFHYNPSSWTMNTRMEEGIDPQNVMGSRPINLPLMGGWAGIGLTVFVNRIVEMTMTREQLLDVQNWASDVTKYQEKGVPDSDPTFVETTRLEGGQRGEDRVRATIGQKVDALLTYGTLADIEYLYKTVNGDGIPSYHRAFLGDTSLPLAMDGKGSSTRTADYGFLNALPVRIWLGPNITFVGRITSVEIQHLLFTEDMIPKYSQVNMSLTRPLTWGSGIEDSNNFWKDAGTGDLAAGVLAPPTGAGTNAGGGDAA